VSTPNGSNPPHHLGDYSILTAYFFLAKISHMENINYRKKMARLRFKDLILEMHESGKSIRDITQKINYRLARTNLGVSLSTFTIHQVIKKEKNELQSK
jgi:hypothetical protein